MFSSALVNSGSVTGIGDALEALFLVSVDFCLLNVDDWGLTTGDSGSRGPGLDLTCLERGLRLGLTFGEGEEDDGR